MKQYCRYCVYLCVNDQPFCSLKNKFVGEKTAKSVNHCKDFVFADVEPEMQDAFFETKGYCPRTEKLDSIIQLDGEDIVDLSRQLDLFKEYKKQTGWSEAKNERRCNNRHS